MIRIQLPQAEADRLEALFQTTSDRKLRARLPIVLMARRGRARQDIATDLGLHRRSVSRWLSAYGDGGLGAPRPREAKGNSPKSPASLADEIERRVIDGPAKQGPDRANWAHEELADHLRKAKGIHASRSAVAKKGPGQMRQHYRVRVSGRPPVPPDVYCPTAKNTRHAKRIFPKIFPPGPKSVRAGGLKRPD